MKRRLELFFAIGLLLFAFSFVFLVLGGEKLAWRYGLVDDVIVHSAGSEYWYKKDDYIRWRMEELIRVAKDLGVFEKKIMPIRLVPRNLERLRALAAASRTIFHSNIYFDYYYLKNSSMFDLDATIIHEFAHLIVSDGPDGHGKQWQKMCNTISLHANFFAGKKVWPYLCLG